jgi:hypothetical protein
MAKKAKGKTTIKTYEKAEKYLFALEEEKNEVMSFIEGQVSLFLLRLSAAHAALLMMFAAAVFN